MIKSMTGFSYLETEIDQIKFVISIKCVNSRYLDININLPHELFYLENDITKLIKKRFNRGKFDIYIGIDRTTLKTHLQLNEEALEIYLNILNQIKKKIKSQSEITLSDILNYNSIITSQPIVNSEKFIKSFLKHFNTALNELKRTRENEGEKIYKEIKKILNEMTHPILKIKSKIPKILEKYKEKLKNRVEEIIDKNAYDENRILIEVAILSDKIDINEEISRLKSHIKQMQHYLKTNKPIGKSIEFLLQEMLRETNTIGSKVLDVELTKNVIKLKENIEQMRELARNIE